MSVIVMKKNCCFWVVGNHIAIIVIDCESEWFEGCLPGEQADEVYGVLEIYAAFIRIYHSGVDIDQSCLEIVHLASFFVHHGIGHCDGYDNP